MNDKLLSDYLAVCPYCGESFSTTLDLSQNQNMGAQQYIEDCQVCCRPITFLIERDPLTDHTTVNLRRDDD